MVLPDRVDEYVGLPAGFLYAGATCVVSTLWAVYDLSSALLMDRFHRGWLGGQTVSASLHAAQAWLRGIPTGVHLRDQVVPELLPRLDPPSQAHCLAAAHDLASRHPDRPPFASPVHWAPFIATGKCYPLPEAARDEG